jgi:hypothetical protein
MENAVYLNRRGETVMDFASFCMLDGAKLCKHLGRGRKTVHLTRKDRRDRAVDLGSVERVAVMRAIAKQFGGGV